jgi:hypothetical protein
VYKAAISTTAAVASEKGGLNEASQPKQSLTS